MEVIVNILAMTIPFSVALVLAYFGRSLIVVAAGACAAVLVAEQLLPLFLR